MASYLGLLARYFCNSKSEASESTLDFLAGACLGMPQNMGTPLTFLRSRGSRRIDHYASDRWNHLLNVERT